MQHSEVIDYTPLFTFKNKNDLFEAPGNATWQTDAKGINPLPPAQVSSCLRPTQGDTLTMKPARLFFPTL